MSSGLLKTFAVGSGGDSVDGERRGMVRDSEWHYVIDSQFSSGAAREAWLRVILARFDGKSFPDFSSQIPPAIYVLLIGGMWKQTTHPLPMAIGRNIQMPSPLRAGNCSACTAQLRAARRSFL